MCVELGVTNAQNCIKVVLKNHTSEYNIFKGTFLNKL